MSAPTGFIILIGRHDRNKSVRMKQSKTLRSPLMYKPFLAPCLSFVENRLLQPP